MYRDVSRRYITKMMYRLERCIAAESDSKALFARGDGVHGPWNGGRQVDKCVIQCPLDGSRRLRVLLRGGLAMESRK